MASEAVKGQRVVGVVPQGIEQGGDLPALRGVVHRGLGKPGQRAAAHFGQYVALQVDHAVAPALTGVGAAGVQFVLVHEHHRAGASQVLAALVAEAFDAPFHRADAKRVVGVRRKGMVHDFGPVQLDAAAVRHAPVQCAVTRRLEYFGHPLGTFGGLVCQVHSHSAAMPPSLGTKPRLRT